MTRDEPIDFRIARVLDGGMATELERRGFDLSGPLWSAHVLDSAPEAIVGVHLDYLRAGADCITAASYQVSARGYRELGRKAGESDRALRLALELARLARAQYAAESARSDRRPVWIAASLGPYGAVLHNGAEYHGQYAISASELTEFHRERLATFAEADAACIAFETIPSLEEAQAILCALARFPSLAAWVSFTCSDAAHVVHGETLRACAELLAGSPQIAAIGINCTAPELVTELIGEARRGADDRKPVIVYPNSGETWDPATRTWRGKTDTARFGSMAREWFAAGAQAVGGCCRTGPAHIAEVAQAARETKG
ncbi:MAG TPA: homocysteine S-methyltransferase [Acidobacteriaceae bacterium]|nr:homocysteine S-methyltransferase [Acidobacteriaceae bacterium]